MAGETKEVLLDDTLIEEDFNGALENLQKSLKSDSKGELRKAKEKAEEEPEEEEAEEESEEEEEEDTDYEKSISEILEEDPEAAMAMDVEPFLRQMAKAVDESIDALYKSVNQRLRRIESLAKSQGEMLVQTAKLEKSVSDMVRQIGGQPVPSGSVRTLAKSRFEGNGEAVEFDNREVLVKSRGWLQEKAISLKEAGKIEGRINKGLLGKVGDGLDQKVQSLMKGGK